MPFPFPTGLHRAVDHWRDTDVGFAMHLGDILDGFCPRDQSNSCLNRVLAEFVRLELPVFHMLGNHCASGCMVSAWWFAFLHG